MERATLLCHSSSSVQLWTHGTPLMKARQKEGSFFLSHSYLKCYANVYCTGDLIRRPAFFSHPACFLEKCKKPCHSFACQRVSATAAGGEVSVDEPAAASNEASTELAMTTSAEPFPSIEGSSATAEPKTQGRRNLNRSNSNKDIVVSAAELLPGAVFTGKVSAIQTFGAFVDFGAFTNGLVHISRLSKAYVKKVEDVVQVGQDVKVQILDVDRQASRISLMLVEGENAEAKQEGEEGGGQRSQVPRRAPSKRSPRARTMTKMKKDEVVMGTVKNMIKSGVFLTLPDGNDGYLPMEEVMKPANTTIESYFQAGQEVSVRVLRIEKGRVTLTTRQEVNFDKINEALNRDVVGGATSPFEIAFRGNPLIASFLAEREKQQGEAASLKDEAMVEETGKLEGVVGDGPAEEVKGAALEEVEEEMVLPPEAADSDTGNLKESIAAVDEAVEQATMAAEEVTDVAQEVLATGGDTKEAEEQASIVPGEDSKQATGEVKAMMVDPVEGGVTAVEEFKEEDAKEATGTFEETVAEQKEEPVDPVEEGVTAVEEFKEEAAKDATGTFEEVIPEQKEEPKSADVSRTESTKSLPAVEEIQDIPKEITSDTAAREPAEVVVANTQQS